jgi:hypothetical protein
MPTQGDATMNKEQKQQLAVVRRSLLKGLRQCESIPSTVALAALVEVTVDAAVSMCGREHAIEVICKTINILMTTKHKSGK